MPVAFDITTAHRTILAVDLETGLIAGVDGAYNQAAPLIALRFGRRANLVVLTANTAEDVLFAWPGYPAPRVPMLLVRPVDLACDKVGLLHPAHLQYLSSRPLAAGKLCEPMVISDRQLGWESFALSCRSRRLVADAAAARAEAVAALLAGGLTAERVIACLAEPWPLAGQALDACLPYLPMPELDALATLLRNDRHLLANLRRLYPEDVWAGQALPGLLRWAAKEERPRAKRFSFGFFKKPVCAASALAEAAPANRRVAGPEFDGLARLDGKTVFLSLPHACAARARRQIIPSRSVAVVASARNEGIYLLEWLAYHRLLGVEAFYLYSNDNSDGSDALLGALSDAGVITWIDNRLEAPCNMLFKAYGHAFGVMPDLLDFAWALVIDLDEFLVIDRARHPDLPAFCDWHLARGADSVAINWQFFAPEQNAQPLVDALTLRNQRLLTPVQMGDGARLVKSLSRPNRIAHSESHVQFAGPGAQLNIVRPNGEPHTWHKGAAGNAHSPKFADTIKTGTAVINHYMFKSAEEWIFKQARNRGGWAMVPDAAPRLISEHSAQAFVSHLYTKNLVVDGRAPALAPSLADEMDRLMKLPRVRPALADVQTLYLRRLEDVRAAYRDTAEVKAWGPRAQEFLALAGI